VLGVAYRGGVKETAFSGAFALRDELVARGANVFAHDPMFSDDELIGLGFTPLGSDTVVDATVVQADHAEYRALDDSTRGRLGLLVDGRDMGINADVVLGAGRDS